MQTTLFDILQTVLIVVALFMEVFVFMYISLSFCILAIHESTSSSCRVLCDGFHAHVVMRRLRTCSSSTYKK